jgi:Spy/CpxP family protein refolding chaperone
MTMKTWIKRTLFGLFATGALLGGLAACSHGVHRHGWHAMSDADMAQMKTRLVDRAASKLDLDEAQKAKLAVLADQMQAQRKAFIGNTADPRADLQALVSGATFDRAKAAALIEGKVGAVQTQSPAVVAALADFYDSLKPEQQAKLRSYMDKRGHRG